MINMYGWDFPPRDILENYVNKCILFSTNDSAFENFRRDEDYIKVLEGGGYEHGATYYNKIIAEYGYDILLNNLDKFRENDIYGNPFLFNYGRINQINNNTMMYIYHTINTKRMFGDYQPTKVIEIGGGYGGMCKTFSVIYPFTEYILIDLPEVIALCKKYLSNFQDLYKKIIFISCDELEKIEAFLGVDLTIAVFSLSECNEETQNMYVNKIIQNSKYSFIGYNKLHIPEVKLVYNKLMERLTKDFTVSSDSSVTDCLYMYLTKE